MTLDTALKLGAYLVAIIGAFFALRYNLKSVGKDLTNHIDVERKVLDGITGKVDTVVIGIGQLTVTLGEHSIALALHDERTSRTAEELMKVEDKIDSLDEKLTEMRISQGRAKK